MYCTAHCVRRRGKIVLATHSVMLSLVRAKLDSFETTWPHFGSHQRTVLIYFMTHLLQLD